MARNDFTPTARDNASPDPRQVADGTDAHSVHLAGLVDVHSRTDRCFGVRRALHTRLAQLNDVSRWTYCADLDIDAQHMVSVTLDHRQTVAYVDLRHKIAQLTREDTHHHAELVDVLDELGYSIEPLQ